MEIAFFTSLVGIIIFLAYKLGTTKGLEAPKVEQRGLDRYDLVDHVFSVGSVVFDSTAGAVRYVVVKSVTLYKEVRSKRQQSQARERDEGVKNKGAASFYIKNIQEHKKALRRKGSESLEKK